jgi:hypothetical protein
MAGHWQAAPFAAGKWPNADLRELAIAVLWIREVEAFAVFHKKHQMDRGEAT